MEGKELEILEKKIKRYTLILKITSTCFFMFCLFLFVLYPAKLSSEVNERNENETGYISGFYIANWDKIYVLTNYSLQVDYIDEKTIKYFTEINESNKYLLNTYKLKITYSHERCHQIQVHQKRSFDNPIGRYFNEVECYILEFYIWL